MSYFSDPSLNKITDHSVQDPLVPSQPAAPLTPAQSKTNTAAGGAFLPGVDHPSQQSSILQQKKFETRTGREDDLIDLGDFLGLPDDGKCSCSPPSLHSSFDDIGFTPSPDSLRSSASAASLTLSSRGSSKSDFTSNRARSSTSSSTLLAMIQNTQEAHTYGNFLKQSCESASVAFSDSVVKYDYKPSNVDTTTMNLEIDALLAQRDASANPQESIPQYLVRSASLVNQQGVPLYPELFKIRWIANKIAVDNHGVLLPGGSSIHPKFYGEALDPQDLPQEASYTASNGRSFLEFCLIQACANQGKPLFGVCRGHQAINIYYGGKLDRHSLGIHQAGKVRHVEWIHHETKQATSTPFPVFFSHEQVVTQLGRGLTSIVQMAQDQNLANDLSAARAELTDTPPPFTEQELETFVELLGIDKATQPQEFEESLVEYRAMNVDRREAWEQAQQRFTGFREEVEQVMDFMKSQRVSLGVTNEFGSPIASCQFHPEEIANPDSKHNTIGTELIWTKENIAKNKQILDHFLESCVAAEKKQRVLEDLRYFFSHINNI